MKATALKEQFLIDAGGKRVGVLLDLNTYERLREAEEELADIAACDAARAKAMAELKAGAGHFAQFLAANVPTEAQ